LQSKKIIHVSFTQHSDYVLAWYEDIFEEFTKKKNLDNVREIKNELIKNRVLMNFNQDGITSDQILRSLKAMIKDGGFNADALIIDGLDFARTGAERFQAVKQFAKEVGLSVWYSCTVKGEGAIYDKRNIPLQTRDYVDLLDVIIVLEPKPDHIALSVSKDRETFNPEQMALRLDPKTLLIQE
jgi:hypothetical protein